MGNNEGKQKQNNEEKLTQYLRKSNNDSHTAYKEDIGRVWKEDGWVLLHKSSETLIKLKRIRERRHDEYIL